MDKIELYFSADMIYPENQGCICVDVNVCKANVKMTKTDGQQSAEDAQRNRPVSMGERVVWVDVVRVIATLLIVVYHMPVSRFEVQAQPEWVRMLLEITQMPVSALMAFFLISGYFTPPVLSGRKIVCRVLALMLPYVVYNSLYALLDTQDFSLARVYGIGHGGCLDYPLWYVFALGFLITLVGVFRKYIWGLAAVCGVFVVMGNDWGCSFANMAPFPSPLYSLVFFAGCLLSSCPIDRIGKVLVWGFPVFLVTSMVIEHEGIKAGLVALMMFSLCCSWEKIWPSGARMAAGLASPAFLCYALHAGAIVAFGHLLQWINPDLLGSTWIYGALPFVIYLICWLGCSCMKRYARILLPVLAYIGQYGWMRKWMNRE